MKFNPSVVPEFLQKFSVAYRGKNYLELSSVLCHNETEFHRLLHDFEVAPVQWSYWYHFTTSSSTINNNSHGRKCYFGNRHWTMAADTQKFNMANPKPYEPYVHFKFTTPIFDVHYRWRHHCMCFVPAAGFEAFYSQSLSSKNHKTRLKVPHSYQIAFM